MMCTLIYKHIPLCQMAWIGLAKQQVWTHMRLLQLCAYRQGAVLIPDRRVGALAKRSHTAERVETIQTANSGTKFMPYRILKLTLQKSKNLCTEYSYSIKFHNL